jgi:hypothetical protein
MRTFIFAVVVILVSHHPSSSVPRSSHGLDIHIFAEKAIHVPGEPIDLRVQFRNIGTTKIRVGRLLGTATSAPFRLSARIVDPLGHVILEPVRDPVEAPCVDLRESDVRRPAIWVELAPSETYTTTLALTGRAVNNLRPGVYEIHGHYRSYGVLTGGHCIDFKMQQGLGSTGTEWEGEIDTNPLSITIHEESPGESESRAPKSRDKR